HPQENTAMRVERKIVRRDVFGGLCVGSVIEQDRAQDGLFRVEVRGQSGIQGQVGDRGHLKNECRTIPGGLLGVNCSADLWESGRASTACDEGLPMTRPRGS